jgi:micrococcal nuclease
MTVRRAIPIVVLVATLGAFGGACSRGGAGLADGANATVVRVVDGDTIVVDLGGSETDVRLIGLDTPETVDPRRPVGCYGPEASARTKELLAAGTPVRLERDAELRDHYGRLLAYVRRASDDLLVNRELVAGGFGEVLSIAPNTAYAAELSAAQREARTAGRGMWSACPPS